MGKRAESFYTDSLQHELMDAINNDFGRAVSKLPNQGYGEVRDEVFVYFSALAMQQANAISDKYGVADPDILHEIYQLMRTNFIQGFRLGQSMRGYWSPS